MSANTGLRPAVDSATERQATKTTNETPRREHTNLDNRYGEIGIPAVAAALRYSEASKNPAYAPAVIDVDWRAAEAAA